MFLELRINKMHFKNKIIEVHKYYLRKRKCNFHESYFMKRIDEILKLWSRILRTQSGSEWKQKLGFHTGSYFSERQALKSIKITLRNHGYALAFFFLREKKITHAMAINNRRQPHAMAAIIPLPSPALVSPAFPSITPPTLSEVRE